MNHRTGRKYLSFRLSPIATYILHIGLPIILIDMLFFLRMLQKDLAQNAHYVLYRYPPLWEHIMMSLTILIIGAFLFDYISREKNISPQ